METNEITEEFLREEYINKQKSYSQIAREAGIKHIETVRRKLEKFNIPRRDRSTIFTEEFLTEQYVNLNKSAQQIAKECNRSASRVYAKLKEYGLIATLDEKYKKKKFGFLTVLKIGEKDKHGHTLLECKCDCGKITKIPTGQLAGGKTRSCGCQASYNKCGPDNARWEGYGEISKTYWSTIVTGAKQRHIDFEITIEEAWELYLKQNAKCALSGVDICLSVRRDMNCWQTASLDRIDSSKGYTIDNIQWLHKDVNKMKWDYNEQDFIDWCKIISDYQKGKNE